MDFQKDYRLEYTLERPVSRFNANIKLKKMVVPPKSIAIFKLYKRKTNLPLLYCLPTDHTPVISSPRSLTEPSHIILNITPGFMPKCNGAITLLEISKPHKQ